MDGHSEAIVDLGAIRGNVSAMIEHAGGTPLMAVVKSDGYGCGLVPTAAAAIEGGASWLAVGHVGEALRLREAGITVPILVLLAAPDAPHRDAVAAGVDLSVGSIELLRTIGVAARAAGRPARLHLKADTGMSRGGAPLAAWPELLTAALAGQDAGWCEIVAIWSHLACADIPGHPSVAAQLDAFGGALDLARRAGVGDVIRHLANTPAALFHPAAWFDLIRPGGGVTGLCTNPGGPPEWLRPALTVATRLVQVKRVPAGSGVSYGHRYLTAAETTLGLIPLGYNEGIPRAGTNMAEVFVAGRRRRIAGTVCMNQCVIDVGDDEIEPEDEVILFGPGDRGEPTAQQWADLLGTISYDIVTRFTGKIPRSYSGVTDSVGARAGGTGAAASGAAGAGAGREVLWPAGGGWAASPAWPLARSRPARDSSCWLRRSPSAGSGCGPTRRRASRSVRSAAGR